MHEPSGMRTHALSILLFAALPAAALADPPSTRDPASQSSTKLDLQVTSSAFKANEAIPPEYTCDGRSVTPPLSWSTVPSNTRSIAILVDDPDAPKGTFTHWMVTGIPPTTTALPAGGALPEGAIAAKNSKGNTGYTGPCPPSGVHHYYFHVYALDIVPARPATKQALLKAISGHILAEGQLVGTYQKVNTPGG